MKYNVTPYSSSQFNEISSWWKESTGQEPLREMLLEDGTFILNLNGVPALCLTVLLTQSSCMSYLFGFVKNPLFKASNMEEYGKILWDHCCEYSKSRGHTQAICFSEIPSLQEKYKRFGMTPTVSNLTGFIKVL